MDQLYKGVTGALSSISGLIVPSKVEQVVIREIQEMSPSAGKVFIRIAGLSGAAAVCLGAYGAHGKSFYYMQSTLLMCLYC